MSRAPDAHIEDTIIEYLRHRRFDATAECLHSERRSKRVLSKSSASQLSDQKVALLKCFDAGSYARFSQLWEQAVPNQGSDPTYKKIEFYCNLHFAMLPFRDKGPKNSADDTEVAAARAAKAMATFKRFLDGRGQSMAHSPEFLPFFALPSIPNPRAHPSFQGMFSPNWIQDIRARLENYLGKVVVQRPTNPKLYSLFAEGRESSGTAGQSDRETKLREFCNSMYGVTVELAQAVKRLQHGQPLSEDFVIYIQDRLTNFRGVLNVNPNTTNSNTASNHSRTPQQQHRQHRQQQHQTQQQQQQHPPQHHAPSYIALDYSIVKQDLWRFSDGCMVESDMAKYSCRDSCLLLQALRLRLARARPGRMRNTVLRSYIYHDLLDCHPTAAPNATADKERGSILTHLLTISPTSSAQNPEAANASAGGVDTRAAKLLEFTCRLVNCLASERMGRSYLLQHKQLIPLLVSVLHRESDDTITRQHALGVLQKFSLRRHCQTMMIQAKMVQWMIETLDKHMKEKAVVSEYTTEYGTALLMNLSLRKIGKLEAEKCGTEIIGVLNELLENENSQVRTYVNGTLYSVLTSAALKERAMAMGLDEILRHLMGHSDPQAKRQIQYILEQLQAPPKDDAPSDEEDDDEATGFDDEEGQDESAESGDEYEVEDGADDESICALLQTPVPEQLAEGLLREAYAGQESSSGVQARFMHDHFGSSRQQQQQQQQQQHTKASPARQQTMQYTSNSPARTGTGTGDGAGNSTGSGTASIRALSPSKALELQQQYRVGTAPTEKHLPNEMKSRPKIPRTPADGLKRNTFGSQYFSATSPTLGMALGGSNGPHDHAPTGPVAMADRTHNGMTMNNQQSEGVGAPISVQQQNMGAPVDDAFKTRARLARTPLTTTDRMMSGLQDEF